MSLLILNLLLPVILTGIDPTITLAQSMTNNETGNSNNDTDFGGLSTESIEIAETNETDLIRNTTATNNNTETNFD